MNIEKYIDKYPFAGGAPRAVFPKYDGYSGDWKSRERSGRSVCPRLVYRYVFPFSLLGTHYTKETVDERFEIRWLYEGLAKQWSRWIPAEAQAQMMRGGSFSMVLEPVCIFIFFIASRRLFRYSIFSIQYSIFKIQNFWQGLRAISLNDEGCSGNNWWLRMRAEDGCCIDEYPDPDNILHWLIEELQAAEDASDRVFLLRHVPNSSRYGTVIRAERK